MYRVGKLTNVAYRAHYESKSSGHFSNGESDSFSINGSHCVMRRTKMHQ